MPISSFPWKKWHNYINQALYEVEEETDEAELILKAETALRQSIARYVRHFRGLEIDAGQIVICAGEVDAAEKLRTLLSGFMSGITFIEPVYPSFRDVFRIVATRLRGCPVDTITSLDDLIAGSTNLFFAYTEQMIQLYNIHGLNMASFFEWLRTNNGYIIQCDRGQSAMPPLSEKQKENVIYLGSFENLLPKELRFSYLILPRNLVPRFRRIYRYREQTFPLSYQLALAAFMNDGQLFNMVRRSVFRLKECRETMIELCHQYLGDRFKIVRRKAYMSDGLVIMLSDIKNQKKFLSRLSGRGVIISGGEKYWSKSKIGEQYFMLSYTSMTMAELEKAFAIIKEILD